MQKRGQLSSEVIGYTLTIVIVGVILVMGYKYISTTKKTIDKGELLQFQNKLSSDIKSIGRDYGTFKKITYTFPQNLEEVCFVDLNKKDEVISSKLVNFYPLVKDSLKSDLNKNIFFVGATEQHSYYIESIQLNHYPYIHCFSSNNGKVEIGIEGLGGGNSLILADFVTKAKISKDSNTVLKSADELISIEVPKGTEVNTEFISIEMVDPSNFDSKGASDIYKFSPSGTKFSKPVELRIKYNPAVVGECPSQLNFYQYNDDGILKATVPSKKIDCKSKIAIFDIDRF